MSTLLTRVGPIFQGDGTTQQARSSKTGQMIVQQGRGKYDEANSRGALFCASNGATGRAPGTVLGTTPPILLFNPVASGKRLSICKVSMGIISGTIGAGTLFHCAQVSPTTIPVVGSGASLTIRCLDIGSSPTSVATAFGLGTLSANPVILYPFCDLGADALSSDQNPAVVNEDVDGAICVEPGSVWCLEAIAAAGSTPLISCGVVWEEVQI